MLQPKRSTYRKRFRGKRRGVALRGSTIAFGDFGLKALSAGWVTSNQIEAARVTLARQTRKGGKLWIRVFPDKPITGKPTETGMGGGKGEVTNHVVVVRPGLILFEISGVDRETAKYTLTQAGYKLPVATKFIEG